MEKYKRNERIGAIIKILADNPNKVITYNFFSEKFFAAKSSISEDILVVKKIIENLEMGKIETVSGAAGGVKYVPSMSHGDREYFLEEVCKKLRDPERIIPGGFLYYTDILYMPDIVDKLGRIIAGKYLYEKVDYVVTMETKGIPVALMTARYLNIPLVIVRRQTRVTEGTTVTINYISGSSSKIGTMSLSKRAMKKGSNVVIVDDFMKGGGTIKGIISMMEEFEAEVKGVSVLIATKEPEKKLVQDYNPLMVIRNLDPESGAIDIIPYNE
ncbi:pur operon repressor [Alkalibacter mobilis]|uniref:pur operon repressor n=1 Tax=Alkalibacter mobilis TaxID=2787712 RepID=UPI00189FC31D|nr:pur operon repressor [Alkalibacter mobilis]